MKRKETTADELPEEVLRLEILTRLPIKSVVRFKSVSLFSDPQFVKKHSAYHSTQNPNDNDCLVANKHTEVVVLSRYKETILLPTDHMYVLIGSINGLICLGRGMKLSLWNPAIHQSKEFSVPPGCVRANEDNIGLGFDSVSNSIKVVALSVDLRSASVYCSDLDSWSDVFVPDNVFPKNGYYKSTPTVIVKGCPYWTCSRYTYDTHSQVRSVSAVKFNAETNEFKLSPEFHFDASVHGGVYRFCYQFVDMKDCLTLMVYNWQSSNCVLDIYSLDGEDKGCCVWSKLYTIGPLNFRRRGSRVLLSQGFKYGGEIVFYDINGKFSCYDHETDKIKPLLGATSSSDYPIRCCSYAPTLFFIQGMKSVHLTTQTHTRGCYRTPRRLINSLRD